MSVHLTIDFVASAVLAAAPFLFGYFRPGSERLAAASHRRPWGYHSRARDEDRTAVRSEGDESGGLSAFPVTTAIIGAPDRNQRPGGIHIDCSSLQVGRYSWNASMALSGLPTGYP